MFDPTWLFLSLIPGGVGFVLFVYGKKQERWPQLAAGVAFMVYPYFTDTVTALIVVGAVLGAALWLAFGRAGKSEFRMPFHGAVSDGARKRTYSDS